MYEKKNDNKCVESHSMKMKFRCNFVAIIRYLLYKVNLKRIHDIIEFMPQIL